MIYRLILRILPAAIVLMATSSLAATKPGSDFYSQISPISPATQAIMKKYTWHPGCPVPLSSLAYIKMSYWGFDHTKHLGVLIVNKKIAPEVVSIFKELYAQKFPIKRMQVMDVYKGNDNVAIAANNTSGFNCRFVAGKKGVYSLHSYGMAIDINTLINPYVKGEVVLPPAGQAYLDRSKVVPGMIVRDGAVYKAFVSRGWEWGGNWLMLQDYQHFEKG